VVLSGRLRSGNPDCLKRRDSHLLAMAYDIHCPECGEFQSNKGVSKNKGKCPKCGNKQAISLYHREDQDSRFKDEKDKGYSIDGYNGKRLY
jgi:rRNA maturation protein Nop10